MDVDKLIQHIPNNVSGDGKPFVAALKKALIKYKEDLNKKIDDSTSSASEKPGHVSSVQLLELHSINDGVRVNSIQVSWVKTTVTNYAKAEVWFRTATDKAWEKAGESSGTQFVYSGATTGLTYYIKVVAVNTKGNTADFDTAPQASIKIQGSQYIPNPPTQFVLTWDEKGPLWKWLFEPNEYIDFFELRLDQNPGVWNDKRLDSTRETWSRANPGVRSGTAYLYIRNIFGEYSEPAVHEFNKAMGGKPATPILTATLDGVNVKMADLPLGYTHYKLHIVTSDGEDDYYTTSNSEYIYFFFSGTITVSYCFVDDISDGEWSDTVQADVKTLIVNAENIADNAVTAAKIRANSIDASKIQAGAVTADKIEAGAITAEKLAADSVTSDAIQAGSVIGDKIAANTITGKHFAAANIDLTGALTITGGNVKLSEEGLRLSNSNGSYTLFNQEGINYVDASGVIYGQVKRMLIGTAYDGSIIKFKAPWESVPLVLMTPTSLMVNNADYSQNNIYITCKPTNVSTEGFSVNCYSSLGTGTTGTVVLNKYISNYQDTSQRTQTFMEFTIVVPKSAGSMTVYGTAHNIPWNRYDNDGYPDKGVGWSNLYVELSGTGVTSTAYHYGPNKNADKSEWNADFSVSAKLNNATKVTCKVYGSWTDTNNYNPGYTSTGGITISIPNVVFDVAGETIVSRGYANFIVIDSASNMYSVEAPTLTTKVLVQYNGSALINTAITVNGESKTTDTDGYITLSATITTETEIAYEFTYNSITVTKGVKYENGAQNIVNITSS